MGGGYHGVGLFADLAWLAPIGRGLATKPSAPFGALDDGVAIDATERGAVHAKGAFLFAVLAFAPFAAGAWFVVGGWGHGSMVAFSGLFLQKCGRGSGVV